MTTTCVLPWVSNALSSLDPADNNCIESTGGSFPANLPNCVTISGAVSYGDSMTWASASTLWTAAYYNTGGIGSGGLFINGQVIAQWFSGSTEVARIQGVGIGSSFNGELAFYTLQSGTMTLVNGVTLQLYSGPPNRLDIKLVGGASGNLQVYVAGGLSFDSGPLNHSGWAGITRFRPRGFNLGTSYWSGMICDSVSHIGDDLYRENYDTESATNTGFSGAVGNINKLVTSDGTFVSATTTGAVGTYYDSTGWHAIDGKNIIAYCVCARVIPGAALNDIALATRTHSTNYFSTTIALPSAGFQGTCNAWKTNPNTGVAWTTAEAQGAEGGMEALT